MQNVSHKKYPITEYFELSETRIVNEHVAFAWKKYRTIFRADFTLFSADVADAMEKWGRSVNNFLLQQTLFVQFDVMQQHTNEKNVNGISCS